MRVALVHDWITGLRGGERVLHEMLEVFPDADIFTLFHEAGTTTERIDARTIFASPLNRFGWLRKHRRWALPLYPWAIRRLQPGVYDLVVSIHHAVAKAIPVASGTPHLCYCLTPMRYVWDQAEAYQGRGLSRVAAYPLSAWLRHRDRATSGVEQVTRFVAISRCVADRVERHYGRRASVLYPPVDIARFHRNPSGPRRSGAYLLVTSFSGYKRADVAIDAAAKLGRALWVVGDGPGRRQLERRARRATQNSSQIRFLGRVAESELPRVYAECRALLQPQEEDFGIAALEAQASGCPVIALDRGGATETVVPATGTRAGGATGIWFSEQSAEALAEAILRFEAIEDQFETRALQEHAMRFDGNHFRDGLRWEIGQLMDASASSCE